MLQHVAAKYSIKFFIGIRQGFACPLFVFNVQPAYFGMVSRYIKRMCRWVDAGGIKTHAGNFLAKYAAATAYFEGAFTARVEVQTIKNMFPGICHAYGVDTAFQEG